MTKFFYALSALCLFGCAAAQTFDFGPCPDVSAGTIDPTKLKGTWYAVRRLPTYYLPKSTCVRDEYGDEASGNRPFKRTETASLLSWAVPISGKLEASGNSGKLGLTLDFIPFLKLNYWIVSTDGRTYSVVYGCHSFTLFSIKYMWVFTKNKSPSEDVIDTALTAAGTTKIDIAKLQEVDQEDCDE